MRKALITLGLVAGLVAGFYVMGGHKLTTKGTPLSNRANVALAMGK